MCRPKVWQDFLICFAFRVKEKLFFFELPNPKKMLHVERRVFYRKLKTNKTAVFTAAATPLPTIKSIFSENSFYSERMWRRPRLYLLLVYLIDMQFAWLVELTWGTRHSGSNRLQWMFQVERQIPRGGPVIIVVLLHACRLYLILCLYPNVPRIASNALIEVMEIYWLMARALEKNKTKQSSSEPIFFGSPPQYNINARAFFIYILAYTRVRFNTLFLYLTSNILLNSFSGTSPVRLSM